MTRSTMMIRKLVLLLALLLGSLLMQLFQLNMRLSFGQPIAFGTDVQLYHIQHVTSPVVLNRYAYTDSAIEPVEREEIDFELILLKIKVRQIADPQPILRIERNLYDMYLDCSA